MRHLTSPQLSRSQHYDGAMNSRTRIFVVIAAFIAIPYFINMWQSMKTTRDASVRSDSGDIVQSGDLGIFLTRVGDCLVLPDEFVDYEGTEEVGVVTVTKGVPCTELHDAEVVGETMTADSVFPGESVLIERYEQFCSDEYEAYTGEPYSTSPHILLPSVPTLESWNTGDRKIQCFALNENLEPLGASIRD